MARKYRGKYPKNIKQVEGMRNHSALLVTTNDGTKFWLHANENAHREPQLGTGITGYVTHPYDRLHAAAASHPDDCDCNRCVASDVAESFKGAASHRLSVILAGEPESGYTPEGFDAAMRHSRPIPARLSVTTEAINDAVYERMSELVEADGDPTQAVGFSPVVRGLLGILDNWHRGSTRNAEMMHRIEKLTTQLSAALDTAVVLDRLVELDS